MYAEFTKLFETVYDCNRFTEDEGNLEQKIVMITGSVEAMIPSPGIFNALPVIYFLSTALVTGMLVTVVIDIRLQCLVKVQVLYYRSKLYLLHHTCMLFEVQSDPSS